MIAVARRVLPIAVFCSLLPALTSRAEPPVLKLAMVRPNDLLARPLPSADRFTVNNSSTSTAAFQPVRPATDQSFRLAVEPIHLSISLLERRTYPTSSGPSGSLFSTRRNLSELGRSKVWATLATGYGQLFADRSPIIYGRNGAAWEEPSCGYFKLSFSF